MRSFSSVCGFAVLAAVTTTVIFVAQATHTSAASFTVNSTLDAVDARPGDGICADAAGTCTLRAAIMEANALPGADSIMLPAGTYTLAIAGINEDGAATGDLDVTDALTLLGEGEETTILDGGALDRVLHVLGSSTATISDVALRNGFTDAGPGGGGILSAGALTLTRVVVDSNTAETAGAGIFTTGSATLEWSTISNNTGAFVGGGIHNEGILTIANTSFAANSAGNGGAISNEAGGTLILSQSNVSGNSALSLGGGIVNSLGATMSLSAVEVNDNQVMLAGGGTFNNGEMSVVDSKVSRNRSDLFGGGISNNEGATLVLRDSTVSGNEAALEFGGGLENRGAMEVTNATISGNAGGGLGNADAGTSSLASSTVAFNSGFFGGGIVITGGQVVLRNTIVADDVGGNCAAPDPITSAGHNLDSDGSCGLTGPADVSNTDPRLGPLADNGGRTLTHALLSDSPAIDAGDNASCPTADQRGIARPIDGDGNGVAVCDIGAYEFQPPVTIEVLRTAVSLLSLTDLKSRGHRAAMLGVLADIEDAVVGGQVDEAIAGLRSLRRRVDGCGSAPDRDDWITNCPVQNDIRALIDALSSVLNGQ